VREDHLSESLACANSCTLISSHVRVERRIEREREEKQGCAPPKPPSHTADATTVDAAATAAAATTPGAARLWVSD
jgi:hypothetical protein